MLTASSARKLLHHKVNLLGGRAGKVHLFPLSYWELKQCAKFSLTRYLIFGGLPSVYLSEQPEEVLNDYIETYLKDEIQREAIVRNITSFTRFFQTIAETNGNLVNFTAMSKSCSVSTSTIREYYQILEDTLLGFMLTLGPIKKILDY